MLSGPKWFLISTNAVKSGEIAEKTQNDVHLNDVEYLNMIKHDFHWSRDW